MSPPSPRETSSRTPFVLNNKDAKPKDKAAYTKVVPLGTVIENGRANERAVKLSASPEYGYPTMFAYRVLIAIIQQAHRAGLVSANVEISRHQIAVALSLKTPGKREYEDIENGVQRDGGDVHPVRGTWYDRNTKSKAAEPRWRPPARAGPVPRQSPGCPARPGGHCRTGSITLGSALFQSLQAGYYNGVNFEYLNALNKNSLAQKLYSYLTKRTKTKRSSLSVCASWPCAST